MSDGFSPTDEMKKEARKGLAWRKEFNRGGTMVGVARARDIANGANLSLDTVKRMNSFFARHEVDKEAEGFRPGEKGYPSNGRIAWALWGGDAGKSWASEKLELIQSGPMIFPEDEEFLAHFGVKGMKWGIRKEDETGGYSKSELYNRKYGPDSMKEDGKKPSSVEESKGFDRLSPNQKKLAVGVGGVALGAAIYVGGSKALTAKQTADLIKLGEDPLLSSTLDRGLAYHWDKGVDLSPGSIIQRLSTEKETSIRPSGFFGAHDKSDVERYIKELPPYWEQWGIGSKDRGGFMTQIRSSSSVKAPSAKESVEIYKSLVDNDGVLRHHVRGIKLDKLSPEKREKIVAGIAVKTFKNFSMHWANGLDVDPSVQTFFSKVKEAGFNALIDFNDSGTLSKSPLRIIDTAGFDVVGNLPITPDRIRQVAASVGELVMSMLGKGMNAMIFPEDEEFLAHYGKKGMKWGVRSRPKNTSKSGYVRKTSASKNIKANTAVAKQKASNLKTTLTAEKNKPLLKAVAGSAVVAASLGTYMYAVNRSRSESNFSEATKTVDMAKKVRDVSKSKEVVEAKKQMEYLYQRNPHLRPTRTQYFRPGEPKEILKGIKDREAQNSGANAALLLDLAQRYPR